ncbi:TPA: hypothetical protein SML94_001128 [Klebsiella oxytoca]|nr:hypothetical protein [Klebsiella oxytoca]
MTTDITELAQREKFEAWWEREYKHLESSKYTDAVPHIKYGFWMAYQAGGAELVEALEKAQKSNEFLKGQLSELANFNPDWDKLEASYESWREIAAELLVAKDRIAELESRTVKLPDDEDGQAYGFGKWSNGKLPATAGTMTISYCEDAWRAAFEVFSSAAGIKWEAE